MQRSVTSHIAAIVVTLMIIVGLPQLPVVFGLGLSSWFSSFWLLLAVLVLLAHLYRARLLGRQHQEQPQAKARRTRQKDV